MELILLNIFLSLLNMIIGIKMYEKKEYLRAMYSLFASGFSCSASIALYVNTI